MCLDAQCPGPCYDFCDCDHCYLGWRIPVRDDDPRVVTPPARSTPVE